MRARISGWLDTLPYEDPLRRGQARLLQLMLLGVIAISLIGLPISRSAPGPPILPLLSVVATLLALAMQVVGLALLRRGQLVGAVVAGVLGLIAGTTLLLVLTGFGGASGIVLGLVLPVVLTGLVTSRRVMLLTTAVSIAAVALVALLELQQPPLTGFIPPPGFPLPGRVAAIALVLAVIALALDSFAGALRSTAAELAAVNRQLQRELGERRAVDESLRASEERYRLIGENTGDLISILDLHGRTIYASPSFRSVLGEEPQQVVGRPVFDTIHPDDLPVVMAELSRLPAARQAQLVVRFRHADGSWRWIDSMGRLVTYEGQPAILAVGRDITQRRLLEAQLAQAQKMESIGRLAGGIAHDFNNILVAIGGYAELARESLSPEHTAHGDLAEIERATARASALTHQLLAFARRQITDPRPLHLGGLLGELEPMLRRLIREDIELRVEVAPALWLIHVDPSQVEQVVVNLVVNARDAMPAGGRLTIEAANAELDAEYAGRHAAVIPGEYVQLAVSDTGIGMDEVTLARAFEPFYTTKPLGQGTGLGLATCYGIVKQNGGNIWLYSEPGQGTTVKVYLPRIAAEAPAPPAREALPPELCGSETILLVEDDAAVRALTVRVLRHYGYEVIETADGAAALAAVAERGATIDLLLTDVVLPGASGRVIADEVMRHHPHVRVLFTSGYTDNAIVHQGRLDPGLAFLQKPFTPTALVRRVREVLDGG